MYFLTVQIHWVVFRAATALLVMSLPTWAADNSRVCTGAEVLRTLLTLALVFALLIPMIVIARYINRSSITPKVIGLLLILAVILAGMTISRGC